MKIVNYILSKLQLDMPMHDNAKKPNVKFKMKPQYGWF